MSWSAVTSAAGSPFGHKQVSVESAPQPPRPARQPDAWAARLVACASATVVGTPQFHRHQLTQMTGTTEAQERQPHPAAVPRLRDTHDQNW
jgi:hypothetical protein